jgi:hypothetical protein
MRQFEGMLAFVEIDRDRLALVRVKLLASVTC